MELPPAQTPPAAAPQGQSTNTNKILIFIIAGIAVLCLVACAAVLLISGRIGSSIAKSVDTDPANVAATADQIASFKLPPGFQPQSSMSILGLTFAVYEAPKKNSALVVFQMPGSMEMTDANIEQMQEQMQQQSDRRLENFKLVKEYDATIRGKPGKVIIQEGTTNGETFRQMLVAFEGKGGLAMMMIYGPKQGWSQSDYDNLVKSIK